jgi:hypothetical protein
MNVGSTYRSSGLLCVEYPIDRLLVLSTEVSFHFDSDQLTLHSMVSIIRRYEQQQSLPWEINANGAELTQDFNNQSNVTFSQ